MATVFPWARESPLVALGLVLSLAAYLLVATLGHQAVRRRLLGEDGAPSPWLRRAPLSTRRALAAGATWLFLVASAYLLAYALTWVWAPLRALAMDPMLALLPDVVALLGIFLGARLLLEAMSGVGRYVDGRSLVRRPQVVHVLERFLRYVVLLSAGVATTVVGLGIVGLGEDAETLALTWLRDQMGPILLLAALVGIGWAGGRIIRAVTSEVRHTSRRFSPRVVEAIGAASRGALFAVLGLVGLITILNAVGQGSVAGTIVVVMSSFIGLAVAMAGTGSIGNALSGAVLVSFRPYEKGDRVVLLDDVVCDVEEVSLMFTKVRTLAREVVEIPNNKVLAARIVNLSRSGPHAMVVRMGIGYDVPHALVRRLGTEAARATPGVLDDPAPQVLARELGTYAIEYELYAYTRNPRHLEPRSELLGKLQETFHGAGVEILTPDVRIVRQGRPAETDGATRVAVEGPRGRAREEILGGGGE